MLERNFVFCLYSRKIFFMELLIYLVTVFCLGMPEIQASHVCIPITSLMFAPKEISYKIRGPTRLKTLDIF